MRACVCVCVCVCARVCVRVCARIRFEMVAFSPKASLPSESQVAELSFLPSLIIIICPLTEVCVNTEI